MRKRFISAFLAVVMCLAVALSGCSFVKMFENDLQLVLKVDSEVYATYNVSIYNNAVVTAPKSKEEGKGFYGWSPQENWKELDKDEVIVVPNGTFITYNDVKDFVPEGSLSVTLYATFFEMPVKDLVIAWYRAEGVSTDTGLTQESMNSFKDSMYTYLETKEYVPADMDIEIRPYDGNVGNSCGQILSDDDVDVMIGWAGNITSTGGITAKENTSGVTVGTVSRYAARLNDKYLTRLIYVWILNTYGGKNLPEPPVDIEEPPVQDEYSMVIGWYSKTGTTGLTETMMADFKTAVDAYLTSQGYEHGALIYDLGSGDVASVAAEVAAKSDVDIIVGMGTNIAANIALKKDDASYTLLSFTDNNKTVIENVCCLEQVNMGAKSRNIALIAGSTNEAAKAVWNWLVGTKGNDGWLSSEAAKTAGIWVQGAEPPMPECAHSYPDDEYEKNDIKHWQICKFCGEPSEKVDHEYGYNDKCVCGATKPAVDPEPTVEYDLVIAWYNKPDTSGITEEDAGKLEIALKEYLAGQDGYVDKKILLRAYDGNVKTSCGNIMNDGDVDIMVGWAANITSTNSSGGQMSTDLVKENVGSITIGSTARYAARLSNGGLCELVFAWIQQNYGPTGA